MIQPPSAPNARGPRPAFVVLWASGPDTALDALVRVRALRPADRSGAWESFDRVCAPPDDESSAARIARDFGLARGDFADAAGAEDMWSELLEFVGAGPLFVPDVEVFEAWDAQMRGSAARAPLAVGLAEAASLLLPGRLALRRDELVPLLVDGTRAPAFGAEDLRRALIELVRRFQALEEDVQRVAATGWTRAWRALGASDPRAAARFGLALALVDTPSNWSGDESLDRAPLENGRLSRFAREDVPLEDLVEALQPACMREMSRWGSCENLPPSTDEEKPFHAEDLRRLDDVFETHLPAAFGSGKGAYRASQHAVAREVARTLGAHELLLVHAPTGTGKTLAYLVPAMLWARRYGVRVGVATYTRALQEQALDREVPRALAALQRSGLAPGTRVSVLKGRENYACWRAVRLALPDGDDAEDWLAWTSLALFVLIDVDADLDRLPRRAPVALASSAPYLRALDALVRGVRARSGCCSHRADRETCGAEIARRKAERSHVVVLNQALALARPDFFKHLVFDECEHLHEQAHNAWSRTLTFRELRGIIARLHQPSRANSRAPLDRLKKSLLEGTPSGTALAATTDALGAVRASIDRLELATIAFERWREEERRTREASEDHALLRQFVENQDSVELVASRVETVRAAARLDTLIAELIERLDSLPVRNLSSLRRALDMARVDLAEAADTIGAWLPLEDGRPAFRAATFYDVERDARGEVAIGARVLLPNEFLGRHYYPDLEGAVFLSATTWIQDGFDAARAYLGLDRAAHPASGEERVASIVRAFRSPEVFDYRRVLVAIPRDAPPIARDKDAFLDYVRRFIAHLGERTRGRMLVLFTNAMDLKRVGEELAGFFRARRIPLLFQNMEGTAKEELSDLFRARTDSILFGVDTFWFGADFPGETLEYLVIVKLPYGVPDRYHNAQCAQLGLAEQRRQIYMPRALSKFRQGFGRLMRRETDRGCVFVLDGRALEPRHRAFLRELPIDRGVEADSSAPNTAELARFVRGDTDRCVQEALAHMEIAADVRRRELDVPFAPGREASVDDRPDAIDATERESTRTIVRREPPPGPMSIDPEDVPF